MVKDYVSSDTARLTYTDRQGKSRKLELLWGDCVDVTSTSGSNATVRARGRTGTVKQSDLGGQALLEVYFIDVGQGDGVLIVTPDRKHVLIDGGYARGKQPTGKNAADFVDWKFRKDYRKKRIHLDAMIASHCDADHYGGLWDLLSTTPAARAELDTDGTDVDVLYHAGVSWWKKPGGGRWLGPNKTIDGRKYLTQLLGDRNHAIQGLSASTSGPRLQGEWANFLSTAVANGCPIERLSHADDHVPGFEPAPGKAALKILAPIEYEAPGEGPLVPHYGSNSQNTNGHSLLLRLDYDKARILLTGDLNKKSMQSLLTDMASRQELQCDVAKGCHHGSDDVSYEFLQAMGAAATVISSGDNEQHAHPRPAIVAASAQTGHVLIQNDKLVTPLVFSTEISRSIAIGKLLRVRDGRYQHRGSNISISVSPTDRAWMDYEVVMSGDLNPKKMSRRYHDWQRLVHAVTYGLVNVRTDGQRILCATLNEKKNKWETESFSSRF